MVPAWIPASFICCARRIMAWATHHLLHANHLAICAHHSLGTHRIFTKNKIAIEINFSIEKYDQIICANRSYTTIDVS